MTGEQVGIVMILIGLPLFLLIRERKGQNSPGRSDVVFLDVIGRSSPEAAAKCLTSS